MEKLDPGGFTCTVTGHLRMGAGLREAKGREWRAGSELECPPERSAQGHPHAALEESEDQAAQLTGGVGGTQTWDCLASILPFLLHSRKDKEKNAVKIPLKMDLVTAC